MAWVHTTTGTCVLKKSLPLSLRCVSVSAGTLQGQKGIGSAGAVLVNHPLWVLGTDLGSVCKSSKHSAIILSSPTSSCFVRNSLSLDLKLIDSDRAPVIHLS